MTVLEIIREYLTANGYGGLYNDDDEDGCGCRLDNLAPCLATCGGNDITGCKAWGRRRPTMKMPSSLSMTVGRVVLLTLAAMKLGAVIALVYCVTR